MSRILFVGDLHVKAFLLPFIGKAIGKIKPDQVICIGDYMDDWGIGSTVNLESAENRLFGRMCGVI